MTAVARTRFLCAIIVLSAVGPVAADPITDLLPPPARQLEKRALGNADMERMYYRGDRSRPGAAFSPDGKRLAVSHPYTGLVIWDLAAGRNVGPLGTPNHSEGMTIAFAPDGKHLLTVNWANGRYGASCPVTLWDANRRERVRSLDEDVNDTLFLAAAFAPDGKTLALAGGYSRRGVNAGLHFWDVASGDELRRLDGVIPADPNRKSGASPVLALSYAPDGRTLALFADGKVLLIETATYKVRAQMIVAPPLDPRAEQMNELPVGAVAFSPDGRTLAVGLQDGTVRRFDIPTGRELPPLTGHSAGVVALAFAADGKTLSTFGVDQKLYVWSADVNRDWRPRTPPADQQSLERLWDTLRSDDALDLYGCTQLLAAVPDRTVLFLRARLTAAPVGNSAHIEKVVADLQKPDYNLRKRAVVELRKIGPVAVPALRQAANQTGDDLLRRLLFEFESQAPPREQVRAVRALELLERIATEDARKLLAELAKGAPEAALTVEAKAALERVTKGSGGVGGNAKLETLWETLAGDDSVSAFQAERLLSARADAPVFLAARLRELAASDAFDNDLQRVAKLLADLDSEDFETRDKAGKALKSLGKVAEPALRKAVEGNPSAEVKRQLEEMLTEIARGTPSAEMLRLGRTLETLEWIGTPEARQAIEAAAKEARGQWLREAAAAALRRTGKTG
jgi:hypothetical protein